MEHLTPIMQLTLQIHYDLKQGISVYDSLLSFIQEDVKGKVQKEKSELSRFLEIHFLNINDETLIYNEEKNKYSIFGNALFLVIEEGLKGVSIVERIQDLEKSMIEECKRNIEKTAIVLPYKGLAPLMLCLFPSLLLLVVAPVIQSFYEVIK
jgi:hypothetical protein